MSYHLTELCVHEIAMHTDYNPQDFKPPFLMNSMRSQPNWHATVSPAYVTAIMACVQSAQHLLDTFISMDHDSLRALPTVLFVRMSYAAGILIKLLISASTPSSAVGRLVSCDSLKVGYYISTIVDRLRLATFMGDIEFQVPGTFYTTLSRLDAWYKKQTIQSDTGTTCDAPPKVLIQLKPELHEGPQMTKSHASPNSAPFFNDKAITHSESNGQQTIPTGPSAMSDLDIPVVQEKFTYDRQSNDPTPFAALAETSIGDQHHNQTNPGEKPMGSIIPTEMPSFSDSTILPSDLQIWSVQPTSPSYQTQTNSGNINDGETLFSTYMDPNVVSYLDEICAKDLDTWILDENMKGVGGFEVPEPWDGRVDF